MHKQLQMKAVAPMGTSGEIGYNNNNNNNNSRDQNQKDNTAKQMGFCVVGTGGPCNGDNNWDGTHDVNGQCVLLNGCANGNGNTNNGMNNNARGK
jgi:hypothetical protein